MSTDKQVESDQTESKSADGETLDNGIEINRSAEEYAKRVVELSAENKKQKLQRQELQKKLAEMESKLSQESEEKLKEQGKYKESYEKTKKELDQIQAERKKEKASYAFKIVTGQLATAATKSGCIDTDALVKLAGANGLLDDLEPDEDFNLQEDNVKAVIEAAQTKMPFLFGKAAPMVKDGAPKKVTNQTKTLDQVSLREKINMLANIDQERFKKATEAGDRRAYKTETT